MIHQASKQRIELNNKITNPSDRIINSMVRDIVHIMQSDRGLYLLITDVFELNT